MGPATALACPPIPQSRASESFSISCDAVEPSSSSTCYQLGSSASMEQITPKSTPKTLGSLPPRPTTLPPASRSGQLARSSSQPAIARVCSAPRPLSYPPSPANARKQGSSSSCASPVKTETADQADGGLSQPAPLKRSSSLSCLSRLPALPSAPRTPVVGRDSPCAP